MSESFPTPNKNRPACPCISIEQDLTAIDMAVRTNSPPAVYRLCSCRQPTGVHRTALTGWKMSARAFVIVQSAVFSPPSGVTFTHIVCARCSGVCSFICAAECPRRYQPHPSQTAAAECRSVGLSVGSVAGWFHVGIALHCNVSNKFEQTHTNCNT